jgi:hypothetical protein
MYSRFMSPQTLHIATNSEPTRLELGHPLAAATSIGRLLVPWESKLAIGIITVIADASAAAVVGGHRMDQTKMMKMSTKTLLFLLTACYCLVPPNGLA